MQGSPAVQQTLLPRLFRLSAIPLALCDSFGTIAATREVNSDKG
jgi:hypothetical protein